MARPRTSTDPWACRYVGTLHEINSETSTVALENVFSFGTEGRKGSPDEEIPASDNIYEYIVFRGSDVKDLRIEEAPAPKENKPPQVPNDPAILGVSLEFHLLFQWLVRRRIWKRTIQVPKRKLRRTGCSGITA